MVTIGICDDELDVRDAIRESVIESMKEDSTEYEIREFCKGEDVIKYISSDNEIDILFLDIQMDGLDGMETARKLREYDRTTEILFVTSIENKISEAFEVRAFRFIKKPVQHEVIEKESKRMCNRNSEKERLFLKDKNRNRI